MKKTEKQIQDKFLKLLETRHIDDIDINSICDSLKIRRQTFYYHYKNIYDVVYSIYYVEKINEKVDSFENILKNALDFLYKKEDFNKEVLSSNASDILSEFLFSYMFKALQKYLAKYKLTIDQKKNEARFLGKSLSEYMLYLFFLDDSNEEMILKNILLFMNEDIILKITKNYIVSFKYNK